MLSVVLLTKNGGALLARALAALAGQRGVEHELLAIDSGSSDGTVERLRAHAGLRLVEIPGRSFQHGRTRNLAMRTARGGLVAFLTQDAVPADEGWLAAYARFMHAHPEVAGAFGHQEPQEDADPLEAWEVSTHFGSFAAGPQVFRAGDGGDAPHARVRCHFFSNVNSCIRRSAWERVPFPEIDFGEDQAWAHAVQQAGMATGYAREAVVRHSHDYGALELLARRYDEARFMRRQFGYAMMTSLRQAAGIARAHAGMYRSHIPPGARARPGAAGRAWASAIGHWAGTRWADRDGLAHRLLSLTERRLRA